jgi:hypothetical protein
MICQAEYGYTRYTALTAANTPVMQLLEQQPPSEVKASPAAIEATIKDNAGSFAVNITNGEHFAQLERLRIEWADPARQPHVGVAPILDKSPKI